MSNRERIDELVEKLNRWTKLYDEGHPEISDFEWDKNLFELVKLENEEGYFRKDSPTQIIKFDVVSSLKKVEHNHLMLSLDKTKDIEEVKKFCGDKDCIAMLKMDGLTCSLRYNDGKLVSAETRGNGKVGEDILHNARVLENVPKYLFMTDELVVDGEIICDTKIFEEELSKKGYKNPRNLAAGNIRVLDSNECYGKALKFVAWDVIKAPVKLETLNKKLQFLQRFSFDTVPFICVKDNNKIEKNIEELKDTAMIWNYPIDGIVFKYNDVNYYNSLGCTDHHFRGGYAFKFYDEEYDTILIKIDYDVSRNGVLTPVAVFEPTDTDDSIVERASLHNISVMKNILGEYPYKGQPIKFIKSNMIIPQLAASTIKNNDKTKATEDFIPKVCPVCGHPTVIEESDDGVLVLKCTNEDCTCRVINKIDHFCSKKGLDIKGLSRATLEKLEEKGWIKTYEDIYKLKEHRTEWINMTGFGAKSVDNILNAIETSKKTSLDKLICACGIPLIGSVAAAAISKKFNGDYKSFRKFVDDYNTSFDEIDNFGFEMNISLKTYNYDELDNLVNKYLSLENKVENNTGNDLKGMTFVITGKLSKSREVIKGMIEKAGGKVTGSVSSKTSYLVCNNPENTTKYKTAISLNIPIINEEELSEFL